MEWRDHRSFEAMVLQPALLAYRTYIPDKNHAVEAGADQEVAMRNWLSKRMDVQIAIPKFEAQGYALLGGRLLPGADRPNCQIIYQRRDGLRMALFMTRERGANVQAMSLDQRGSTALAHWSNGTLSFVIAGDTSREELRVLADAARSQLGSPSPPL
jgi:anti-sigma factor RsiW